MVGFWFYKYEVEDRDIGVVDYELLERSNVKRPSVSMCFRDPFLINKLKQIGYPHPNKTTYLQYLKGRIYDYKFEHHEWGYENVTMDL